MDIFLTNVSCVLLTLICIIVFNVIGASDNILDDSWNNRRLSGGVPLVTVGHVIDVGSSQSEQTILRLDGHAHIGSSCQAAVTQLTDAVSQYADCVSLNALNSSVCENCVDYYLNAAAAVVAADSSALTDEFGSPCSERLSVTEGVVLTNKLKQIVNSWTNLSCAHCFVNETTRMETNETLEFTTLSQSFYACIANVSQGQIREPFTRLNGTLNTTACDICSDVYQQMSDVYSGIQHRYTHTVCADTLKVMNYSRRLWNDVMQCRRQPLDIVALMLVSCFLALLPATFYIASYINSSDVTNNLLQQKRLRDSASVSQIAPSPSSSAAAAAALSPLA